MKRIKFLSVLLLLLIGGGSVKAGNFTTSTVDNPVEYYVCCVGNSATRNYYVVWDTSASKFSRTNAALTTNFTEASTIDNYPYEGAAKFIIIATETQGLYKIYCTTSGTYATYSNASNGASAVTSTATESEAKTWKIITNRGSKAATPYAFDIVPGEIETLADNSPSWNFHGGVGQELSGRNVGFWNANDDSSVWSFVPVAGYSNFVPAADKAYYIDPVKSGAHLAFYMPGISNAVMGVHGLVGNGNTPPSLGNLFTITATSEYVAGEQWFTISPYALDDAHQGTNPSYVRWLNTNDVDANVAVATTNSNNKWRILQSSTTGRYTIRPNSVDRSWNCRGSSNWDTAIGLWDGYGNVEANDNLWEFTEINASDAAVRDPLVGAYRTLATQRVQSKVSYPEPDQDCLSLPTHEAFNDLLNTIRTTSDLGTLQKAVGNLATLPVKTFTSADNGVYTIKNVALNKYLYITDTDNAKHATLLNDETEMKQKHYFYVKFNDNGGIISIKNSTGFEATRGPQSQRYTADGFSAVQLASESSPLAMQIAWNGANLTGANTFLLPTVHSTAQTDYTIKNATYNSNTNPYFLTTWTTTGTADQYVFTKVDITDAARRDVVIFSTSDSPYVTYDSNNVYNGGFVYSVAPAQSEFTAMTDQTIRGYECGDDFVRVLYDVATPSETDKTAAQTLLAKTGVGYPKADAEVRANLTKLLGYSFMPSDEFTAAIASYKGTPSQIQLPESGKAYTITFRPRDTSTGTYRYIYRDGETTNLKTAVRDMSTPASGLPASAVFVCNEFEAGKYIFTPVTGGGFVKVNTGNSASKLQVGATYAANINDIVFQPLTDTNLSRGHITDTSNENLFSYMAATIQEREDATEYKYCLIINEGTGAFDKSDAPYLDGSFTSALIIEEVDYANHPTLLEIKGDKMSGVEGETHIGTFSAPFETVIPTGVRAYYAQTAEASTGISLAEISSGTIPANEGVIITATTATPGYFAPATTSTSITGNKLSNSAGAAHAIVDYDYILATANEVTALYKAKVGGSDLKMNKAYLNLGSVLSPSFKLSFDGELTGIASTLLNADESDSLGSKTPVYDLSGRRVAQPMRGGIYIRDGKKFIVK